MKVTAILSAISAATLVSAGTFHKPLNAGVGTVRQGYIIEYEEGFDHNHVFKTFTTNKVNFNVRNKYNLFNGAAIDVKSTHDGQDLANMPNVKNVWPISIHPIPKVRVSDVNSSDPPSLHQMTGMDIVSSQYNLTGTGIKVGIIDTGVDYRHPAFATPDSKFGFGCLGKNCRTTVGWDFAGDAYDGFSSPVPGPDPMDCNGHGTHVAGIVGANALNITGPAAPPVPFVGVAPNVTFGAYRVFGCEGGSGDDLIMAAMERAYVDGMDIINMSLGGGSNYKTTPQAVLGDKLVAKGISLAVAAGNDGADGVWMVSDASLGDSSVSVASFDNIYTNNYFLTYDSQTYPYALTQGYGQAINITSSTIVPIYEKNGTLSNGCDPTIFNGTDVTDKVVLVLGGTNCHSGTKGQNAYDAGAAAILLQSTSNSFENLGGLEDYPMGSITQSSGMSIQSSYKADSNNIASWSDTQEIFRAENGGGPSSFSSYGLDGDLRSKPDLAGPGGNILSTYPLDMGAYAVLSGTSMATPYIAGVHAIYMQYKGAKVPGPEIRKALKNTATIYQNNVTFAVRSNTTTATSDDTYVSVVKQGGGLVNILRAITTATSISPDHINLLDTNNFVSNFTITITNTGNETEVYNLSHIPSDALNSYPNNNTFPLPTPEFEPDHATVTFAQSTVSVAAGASVNVTLTFVEPATGNRDNFPLYSGYVVATPSSNTSSVPVSIPYTGMKGSLAQVPIMDTDSGFPKIAKIDLLGKLTVIDNQTVSENGTNVYSFNFKLERPVFQTRLGSHTPSLQIRISDIEGNFIGYMVSEVPVVGPAGRVTNLDLNGDQALTNWLWDAKVTTGNSTNTRSLSSGQYQFVVAAQRKFTAGNYPEDFEVYSIGNVKF